MFIFAILFCASCAQAQNKVTSEQARQIERIMDDAITEASTDKDGAQRLIKRGDEFTAYIMAGFTRFTAKTPGFTLAREILGDVFLAPDEIAAARGLTYSEEQIAELERTIPDRETLEWLKLNNYMLVAGSPSDMSLLDIVELNHAYFLNSKKRGSYFNENEAFASNEKVTCRWYMIHDGFMPNSTSKTWSEQQRLFSDYETASMAVELVWALTCYKEVRSNTYRFGRFYARTSSVDSRGIHISICLFEGGGLGVATYWNDRYSSGNVGVFSLLKL